MTIDEISNVRVYVIDRENLENKKAEITLEQVSEGCISREAVIEWLKDKDIIKTKNQEENARKELAFLSSVVPQLKIGKWKLLNYKNAHAYSCSECGETVFYITNYCPNCGTKMEVTNE